MAYDTTTTVVDDVTDNLASYHNQLKTAIDKVMSSVPYAAYGTPASMTGNVVLTDADFPVLSYSPTAARDLTFPALATTNHPFYVINRSATYAITAKDAAAATITTVGVSSAALIVSDGANNWYVMAVPYVAPGADGNVLTAASGAWTSAAVTGWSADANTWTRTGNHTFTIAADVTAIYTKGTKVRYKDGGAYEYGVVFSSSYSSPNTTITLITNTSYTMAAATITDKYYSYSQPPDFPVSFTFTPVWTASTPPAIVNGSITAYYSILGKILLIKVRINMGASTTYGSGNWNIGAPCTVTAFLTGAAMAFDNGTALHIGVAYEQDTTYFGIVSEGGVTNWQSTVPHTWAVNDYLDTSILAIL